MAVSQKSQVNIETELSRDLGLTTALAIGVGTMIAAGIFTLSGLAIRNVGSAAIVSFLLAAVVATFTALTYCEFVSIYPRSGEGYLYARKTYPAPLAYFVGWALILGYTSSCAFYIASLSSYFQEFVVHLPVEALSGLVILIALTLLNIKGTKESGTFQVWITIGKVLLLIWFIFGGMSYVDTAQIIDKFNTDIVKIGGTAAMVFITFFGFSAIAASAGEVKDPVKNIPRAIFISMTIVTILYTGVVLVVLFAGITEYSEASMGVAATKFLGPIGGKVIIAGALFSMISASNASIMAGSRVALAMSQLGHLPREFGTINPNTKTPIIALMLTGGAIFIFALILPLEDLAHFADTVLLLVLILVNIALIYHRRKFPDIERPFKVPLVPLLPALGIMANFYLLAQITHHIFPFLLALASLLLGMVAFLAWKGVQPATEAFPGKPSKIALGRYAISDSKFKILVPIANPANIEALMELACAVAKDRQGEIVALRVSVVPEQMPPSMDTSFDDERHLLEIAHRIGQKAGIPVTTLVRVGHNAARAILETAAERDCQLIVLGWKGFTSKAQKILGEISDAVVTHARSDLMLVKLAPNAAHLNINKLLLPTAGGDHAQCAEQYAASIMRHLGGTVTVCKVEKTDATQEQKSIIANQLSEAVARISAKNGLGVASKVLKNDNIPEAIIAEANDHDAVVVGATRDSIYPQILFGSIPEHIAKNVNKTVIMVKYHNPVKALLGRVMGE